MILHKNKSIISLCHKFIFLGKAIVICYEGIIPTGAIMTMVIGAKGAF